MPGLLDIATSSRTVSVKDVQVPVYGISAQGIAVILQRFPVVREMFSGKSVNFDSQALFALGPQAVAVLIAAGTGTPGDAAAEEAAARLPAEYQFDFLEAIIAETMPSGFGPFVARVAAIAGTISEVSGGLTSIPDTK